MRILAVTLVVLTVSNEASAQQQLSTVQELLAAEVKAAQGCEGTGDTAIIKEQCTLRDRLGGRLAQAGYCWGRKGQMDAKKEWHPCGPDSIYIDDIEGVRR